MVGDPVTPRKVFLLAASLVILAAPRGARAEVRLYTIAVGNNSPPASNRESLGELRYADDDAAAFFAFAQPLSVRAEVLTTLDTDSQRRFPSLVDLARPPTLQELRRTVGELAREMAADIAAGHRPVLLFFYSGHGAPGNEETPAALTLLDEGLTQQRLYQDLLSALPGATIHLLIDACYAEDVVRPRDLQLKVVDVSDRDVGEILARTTLAQFPRVGAVVASSTSGQTHEWDLYHQGVFTHELLSGLRGAADVNSDDIIEYSELTAFLSAANREVSDARARLRVVSHAPISDRRLPIVDLRRYPRALRLAFSGPTPGYFFIEDGRGNRLVELHSDESYPFRLYLPAGEPLYLVSPGKTVEFQGRPGDWLSVAQLGARPSEMRARGTMAAALRRGLFAASFGPSYYRGFVDSAVGMISVDFAATEPALQVRVADRPDVPAQHLVDGKVIGVWSAAIALAAASVTLEVLAARARQEHDGTTIERAATDAEDRFQRYQVWAAVTGAGAALAAGAGGWMVWRRRVALVGAGAVIRW